MWIMTTSNTHPIIPYYIFFRSDNINDGSYENYEKRLRICAKVLYNSYVFIGARLHGARGARAPQSQGPGAHHKVEPPQYFVIQNLIFMYYFDKLTQLQLDLHNVI